MRLFNPIPTYLWFIQNRLQGYLGDLLYDTNQNIWYIFGKPLGLAWIIWRKNCKFEKNYFLRKLAS